MKYLILFLFSFPVFSGQGITVYSVNNSETCNICAESDTGGAMIEAYFSVDHVNAGFSMGSTGIGFFAGGHARYKGVLFGAGLMLVEDTGEVTIPGYEKDKQSRAELAPFIEVGYSFIKAKIAYYDTNINYSSTRQNGVDINGDPIYESASLQTDSKNMLYMLGVSIPF